MTRWSRRAAAWVTAAGLSLGVADSLAQSSGISATEGQQFSGTVVTFSGVSRCAPVCSATIAWGDGTSSSGTVVPDPSAPGTYAVQGSHTYGEEGSYTAVVSLSQCPSCSPSQTQRVPATVGDAPLSGSASSYSATAGQPSAATLARFSDADPGGTASDYTAAINWGDGSATSPGSVTAAPGGGFQVTGGHTNSAPGTYTVTVSISDHGASITLHSQISVEPVSYEVRAVLAPPGRIDAGSPAGLDASRSRGRHLSYRWDIDGSGSFALSTGATPFLAHVFSNPGSYRIRVRVSDDSGTSSEAERTVLVLHRPAPRLRFIETRPRRRGRARSRHVTLSVPFQMPTRTDRGSSIRHYLWDFGDGRRKTRTAGGFIFPGHDQPSTSPGVVHHYAHPGIYHADGYAVDSTGGVTEIATTVDIACPLSNAQAAAASGNGCGPQPPPEKLLPLGLSFADDPQVGQSVHFAVTAGVVSNEVSTQDQIKSVVGEDPNGNPVFGQPNGTGSTNNPGPSAKMSVDFGDDGGLHEDDSGDYHHAYAAAGVYNVTVQVSLGDQSETLGGIVHVEGPPVCGDFSVAGYSVSAEGGGCFSRIHTSDAVAQDPLDPSSSGPRYYLQAQDPAQRVDIGGLSLASTDPKGPLTLDPFTGTVAGPKGITVYAGDQRLYRGDSFTLSGGSTELPIQNPSATLDGLPVVSGTFDLPQQGTAAINAQLKLPAEFQGTSQPASVTPGQLADPSQDAGVSFDLPDMSFGPVELTGGVMTNTGAGWSGSANLVLFDGPSVGAALAFDESGDLTGASVSYTGPPDIPLVATPPILIHSLGAVVHPEVGNQAFSLAADPISLNVAGVLNVNGCFGFTRVNAGETGQICGGDHGPGTYLGATGSVELLGVLPLDTAYFLFSTPPSTLSVGGHFHTELAIPGVITIGSVDATINASFSPPAFYVYAGADACLLSICGGGFVSVTQKGIAACIPTDVAKFGGWILWDLSDGGLLYHGCDVETLASEHLMAADAGSALRVGPDPLAAVSASGAAVRLRRGPPFELVGLRGRDHSPIVRLLPPHGGAPITDTGAPFQQSHGYVIIHCDGVVATDLHGQRQKTCDTHTTYVAIRRPTPGVWRVATMPFSPSPITAVQLAHGLGTPHVRAQVVVLRGSRRRILRWRASGIAGQRVIFAEMVGRSQHVLVSSTRLRGSASFTPADGRAGPRALIALIQNGQTVRATLHLGSYTAPPPLIPGRPRLWVRRRPGALTLSWSQVAGAARYRLAVRLGDGRRLTPTLRGRSFTITGYRQTSGASVTVTAVSGDGRPGLAATARIRPARARRRLLGL